MALTPTGAPFLASDEEGDAKSSAGMSSAVTVYSEIVLSNKEKLFEKAFQEFKSHFIWIELSTILPPCRVSESGGLHLGQYLLDLMSEQVEKTMPIVGVREDIGQCFELGILVDVSKS
jgi:hypothetical protein